MAQHAVEQERPLLGHAKFEEPLDYVICEEVPHQKQGVTRHDFIEYDSKFIWRSSLKLGLDEPRSVLVTGKLDDVLEDILNHSDQRTQKYVVRLETYREFPLASFVALEFVQQCAPGSLSGLVRIGPVVLHRRRERAILDATMNEMLRAS